MKPWYLPLPSPMNINACNLKAQRDTLKSTKCTVGEKRVLELICRGGIQNAGKCPNEEKMKCIHMSAGDSWELFCMIWSLRNERGLTFTDWESIWLWKDADWQSISWSNSQKGLRLSWQKDAPGIKTNRAGRRRAAHITPLLSVKTNRQNTTRIPSSPVLCVLYGFKSQPRVFVPILGHNHKHIISGMFFTGAKLAHMACGVCRGNTMASRGWWREHLWYLPFFQKNKDEFFYISSKANPFLSCRSLLVNIPLWLHLSCHTKQTDFVC